MSLPHTHFIEAELRSPLMHLPVRTVVFELATARVLYAPASTLTRAQLDAAGPVTDVVSPSLQHTAGMKAASDAHPTARLWGPVGIREKQPALQWHGVLGVDAWPFESELALVPLAGMPKIQESAFVHRASKALYLTDMVFHIRTPKGLLAWLFFRMFGTYRRFAVSKLFLRYVDDKAAFEASLARLLALDFEHVVWRMASP